MNWSFSISLYKNYSNCVYLTIKLLSRFCYDTEGSRSVISWAIRELFRGGYWKVTKCSVKWGYHMFASCCGSFYDHYVCISFVQFSKKILFLHFAFMCVIISLEYISCLLLECGDFQADFFSITFKVETQIFCWLPLLILFSSLLIFGGYSYANCCKIYFKEILAAQDLTFLSISCIWYLMISV